MTERPVRDGGSWPMRRLRSFGYAWNGLLWLIRSQQNARIHLAATVCVLVLGFWLRISRAEWGAIVIVLGMVWSAEALNSALEILADHLHPDDHPLVGRAKDVAAGGVLVAAIAAAVVGVLVFGPRILARFGS